MGNHEAFLPTGEPQSLSTDPLLGHARGKKDGWMSRIRELVSELNYGSLAKCLLILLAIAIGVEFIREAAYYSGHHGKVNLHVCASHVGKLTGLLGRI
jgi:hypothetical protein